MSDWLKQMHDEAEALREAKKVERVTAEDGAYLFYVKGGKAYPVIMTKEEHKMLQALAGMFQPLKLAPYPMDILHGQELIKQIKAKGAN